MMVLPLFSFRGRISFVCKEIAASHGFVSKWIQILGYTLSEDKYISPPKMYGSPERIYVESE